MRQRLLDSHRLVVKVGSALVTDNGTGLDLVAIAEWARQIAQLREDGRQVALVSSGAHCSRMQRLGWVKRPHVMHELRLPRQSGKWGWCKPMNPVFPAWLEDCSDFADS